ncbi:hypothetical protein H257_11104 [Aphanomyces astaci]|uniref:Peptidase M28 domain-containing protein n=1 Tax=Aphanomyces astaci TaxID=112090 RepID=W4G540_APHAT|nr:hypothetical protein H257_11104 [Aphanomyces astaci]ETV74139.1 hypothetical protein H257_11104 [Aphanomyces astaci]|eukprot:XP_009836245.1 hypothetical protein H257_11104 [Aphanomyces astaci]
MVSPSDHGARIVVDVVAVALWISGVTDGEWTRVFELGAARQAQKSTPHGRVLQETTPYPTVATYEKLVRGVIAKIQTADLKRSLESFVNKFANRIFNTAEGAQSCGWIYDQVVEVIAKAATNPNVKVTVRQFTHKWKQYSVIARMLIATYVGLPVSRSVCGYYCSDHFAWNVTGYPSSYPFETELKDKNPYMHSQNDTIATIDFNHMADFTKLSIAYVVELTQ